MDDLAAWLRAQLDDDERVARAAANHGPTWRYGSESIYPSDTSRHPGAIATGAYGGLEDEHGEHIARHDPARVLAEVDAKRRILDLHQPVTLRRAIGGVGDPQHVIACDYDTDPDGAEWIGYPCETIRLLALPYADRPGYREE